MSFENRYTLTERLLHKLAFATPGLQIGYAEIEDKLYGVDAELPDVLRPVFITALPRAGTTLLLNICAGLDEFAAHTYRDMPFIMTPLVWSRFSDRFTKSDAPRERAHGDGMLVSADSPEAFEEIIWKAFWPEQYKHDRILVWPEAGSDEFREFFRRHMHKLARVRGGRDARLRYASKNNFNVARLRWLMQAFPDASIIVPFRAPVEHAASLLRQHLNFIDLHQKDRFMRDYMKGIGHFDFGANLRPIDFDGWLDGCPHPHDSLNFWLAYWTAGYRHCFERASDGVALLDYDELCRSPKAQLGNLADLLGIGVDKLESAAPSIKVPRPHNPDQSGIDPEILSAAVTLHDALRHRASRSTSSYHA
jgi:Sulfotransferase family